MGLDTPLLGDNMASNNWAVHGDHTENGSPLLANDPHLQTTIPANWVPMEIVWGDISVSGVTMPGAPGIHIGRT